MKENYLVKINTKANDTSEEYVDHSLLSCKTPVVSLSWHAQAANWGKLWKGHCLDESKSITRMTHGS